MWTLYTLSPPDLDVQVDRLLRGSEWCLHLVTIGFHLPWIVEFACTRVQG